MDHIEQTYQALHFDTARAVRLLGHLPARTLTPDVVAAVCAVDRAQAQRVLTDLLTGNLVQDSRTGQDRDNGFPLMCALHENVSESARRWADVEPQNVRDEALRRWVEWYLAAATAAEARLSPSHRTLPRTPHFIPISAASDHFTYAGDRDVVEWLDRNRPELLEAIAAAHAAQWYDLTWQLVDATQPLWVRRRHVDDWIAVHTRYGIPAAEQDRRHPRALRRMLTTLAAGLRSAGRHDEALEHYRRAAELARKEADRSDPTVRRDEAQALHGMGDTHRQAGRYASALPFLRQALAIREEIGYVRGAALTRLVLADITAERRNWDTARDLLVRARADLLAVPDPHDAARALAFLGRARARCDDYQAGVSELVAAGGEFTEAGSPHWSARTCEWRGEAARDAGLHQVARTCFTDARAQYAALQSLRDVSRLDEHLRMLDTV
ncbi:tetratricopeptide repeat protein [Streptomyces niveus]|uniref:tetratricopeptide repeat protein n=1 Tax=Streptomyces niveus TaxID=193462 RepID=UPI0036A20A69